MPKTTISTPEKDGYRDGDYVYRPVMGNKAADWFGKNLRLPEDPHAGEPFHLAPWQADYIKALYGWRHRKNEDRRRYTTSCLEVARSNGKTGLHAGLGIKGLQGDRAAWQRGLARNVQNMAQLPTAQAQEVLRKLLGRNVDIYGLLGAAKARQKAAMLAELQGQEPDDALTDEERRRRGMLGQAFWQ